MHYFQEYLTIFVSLIIAPGHHLAFSLIYYNLYNFYNCKINLIDTSLIKITKKNDSYGTDINYVILAVNIRRAVIFYF
jgi:hypothetical protein